MAKIPCGFVTDSEGPLDLIRRHALARFTEEQGSEKPFLQGEMRVIKYRTGGDSELIIASLAVKELLRGGEFNNRAMTAQAFNSARPAKTDQKFAAFVIGIEQVYNVN
jgi:hypothetical protein